VKKKYLIHKHLHKQTTTLCDFFFIERGGIFTEDGLANQGFILALSSQSQLGVVFMLG
jgi:hypothetical protein